MRSCQGEEGVETEEGASKLKEEPILAVGFRHAARWVLTRLSSPRVLVLSALTTPPAESCSKQR